MIYLHIGMARAGSSTIQRFLAANTPLLAQNGIHVPGNRMVHQAARVLHAKRRLPSIDQPQAQALRDLQADLAAHKDATIIVSSEYLGARHKVKAEGVKLFRSILPSQNVRIVIYIRDYPSRAVSAYNQHTSMGRNTHDIDVLVSDDAELSRPWVSNPWVLAFGRENVRFRAFNDLVNGSLTRDFATTAGIAGVPNLDLLEGVRVKSSDTWIAIELARRIAQLASATGTTLTRKEFVTATQMLRRKMIGADQIEDWPKVQYLTPEQWTALRDAYNRDVATINANFPDHALPEFTGTPPGPRPFVPSFRYIPDRLRQRLLEGIGSPSFRARHTRVPPPILDALIEREAGATNAPARQSMAG